VNIDQDSLRPSDPQIHFQPYVLPVDKSPLSGCRKIRKGLSVRQAMFLSTKKKERSSLSPRSRRHQEEESPVLDLIEDDLRTFEEKYVVHDQVIGEGCASIVK